MYLHYFGFDEPPFSITPDPKFVFLSKKHQESLAHLVYGITRGGGAGFVQLTGEVGTGKTTISRLLLAQIPEKTNIALILNPTINPIELLETICKELKIPLRGITGKLNRMVEKLNEYLLNSWSNGENTVVIIDEAQNLPRDTLEQLRLLTNLETDKQKLLQIILIGQPELRTTMRRSDLRQLAQRVTARYHLMPLSSDETYEYIQHRVIVAGGDKTIITKSTARIIHKYTNGVPRLINILTDRSLLAAYSDGQHLLTRSYISIAAREVNPEKYLSKQRQSIFSYFKLLSGFILVILLTAFLSFQYLKTNSKSIDNTSHIEVLKSTESEFIPATALNTWKYYFKLWDTQNDKNWHKPQCPDSLEIGMACLRRQGNFNQIVKLNHPVILQMQNSQLVLLSNMSNDKIRVLNNKNEFVEIDTDIISKQWLGGYFILWPMPADFLTNSNPAAMNSWALEMANVIAVETVSPQQLDAWIKTFQAKNGLLADGIIGPETQMALSLNAYSGPTLR